MLEYSDYPRPLCTSLCLIQEQSLRLWRFELPCVLQDTSCDGKNRLSKTLKSWYYGVDAFPSFHTRILQYCVYSILRHRPTTIGRSRVVPAEGEFYQTRLCGAERCVKRPLTYHNPCVEHGPDTPESLARRLERHGPGGCLLPATMSVHGKPPSTPYLVNFWFGDFSDLDAVRHPESRGRIDF